MSKVSIVLSDIKKNTAVEADYRHFDESGNLNERDVRRQKEIEEELKCKFIRIKV